MRGADLAFCPGDQIAWQWAYSAFGDEQPTLGAKRFTNETTNPTTGSTMIPEVTSTRATRGSTTTRRATLDAAVECPRGCRDRRAGQGVRTRRTVVRKDEQRSLARRARCHRVHSALSIAQLGCPGELYPACVNAVTGGHWRGQLPDPGLGTTTTSAATVRSGGGIRRPIRLGWMVGSIGLGMRREMLFLILIQLAK